MSTIPAYLDAFAAMAQAALGADFQVGQGSTLQTEQDYLIVGYADDGHPAIAGSRTLNDAAHGDGETYSISNVLSVWIGDTDLKAVRDQLFGYLDTLDAALAADRYLGIDAVMDSMISDFEVRQTPSAGQGAQVDLIFTVTVRATR